MSEDWLDDIEGLHFCFYCKTLNCKKCQYFYDMFEEVLNGKRPPTHSELHIFEMLNKLKMMGESDAE